MMSRLSMGPPAVLPRVCTRKIHDNKDEFWRSSRGGTRCSSSCAVNRSPASQKTCIHYSYALLATVVWSATRDRETFAVDMRLEVLVLPVSDVDRAKEFYTGLGWRLDADFVAGDDFRVVQLTPPGSPCSIIFGTGITTAVPGSAAGLYLVVEDIEAARAELNAHDAQVGEVFHDSGGVFHHAGTTARVPGPDPQRTSYASFAEFNDPDGNGWMLQEITTRLPGR